MNQAPTARLKKAFLAAAGRIQKTSRTTPLITDPDVKMYLSLTPDDFETIRIKYGMSKAVDYVSAMERKLRSEKTNEN